MIVDGIQDTAHAREFELNYLPNRQVKVGRKDPMIDQWRHLVENSLENLFYKKSMVNLISSFGRIVESLPSKMVLTLWRPPYLGGLTRCAWRYSPKNINQVSILFYQIPLLTYQQSKREIKIGTFLGQFEKT